MQIERLPAHPFGFIKLFSTKYLVLCLVVILINAIWAADLSIRPYLIKLIIDAMGERSSETSLGAPILIPVGCYILVGFFTNFIFRCYDYVSLKLFPHLWEDVFTKTYSYILNMSGYAFFQGQLSGTLSSKITELATAVENVLYAVLNQFSVHSLALLIACYTLELVW